jgi:hypothetical protein
MRAAVFLDGKLGHCRGQVNAVGSLVYLQDDKTKQKYLVDTGGAVSVLPHKQSSTPTGPILAGADGKTIPSWGSVTRSLSFGMRTFLCTFILAAVSIPVPGTDFLSKHRLLVDPAAGQVLDAPSLSPVGSNHTAVASRPDRSSLEALLCHIAPAARTLFSNFPASSAMDPAPQSQPTGSPTPLTPPAGQSLKRPGGWIRISQIGTSRHG